MNEQMQKPNPISENNRKLLNIESSQEVNICGLFLIFISKEKFLMVDLATSRI